MGLFYPCSKVSYWIYFSKIRFSKITGNQFGLSESDLITPISELSPFEISWYLFDLQPFKSFIGIAQMLCGILLIWNRTAIIGAFIFLPIVSTILIMDMTFMPYELATAFTWRLSYYIFLDLLILWHYRDRMITIWQAVWNGVSTKFKFSIWVYLTLPVMAILMEFISPRTLYRFFVDPIQTMKDFRDLFGLLIDVLGKFF